MAISSTIYFDGSSFNPLEQHKKSRLVAGLLLMTVVSLHMALAFCLLNAAKTERKKPLAVMNVAILPKPEPAGKQQAAKEPPPAPVRKEPIKSKSVVKSLKTVKKTVVNKPAPAPKHQPAEMKEVIPVPKFEPAPITAPPVVAPAPATAASTASKTANSQVTAKTTGHGSDSSKVVVSGVVPLVRVPPKYPARAARRHIEGWVKVEFTITTDGSVADAVVISSEPESIFDDAALTAISKWEFKEKIVGGVAVPQRAVQKLQFKLQQ
ncbi:MAG: energy transducer TonB [Methylococcales bacterium]|nr:energy transducer TonB [Methylococcales bacterium]